MTFYENDSVYDSFAMKAALNMYTLIKNSYYDDSSDFSEDKEDSEDKENSKGECEDVG